MKDLREPCRIGDGKRELTRCENIRKELVSHISIFVLGLSFEPINLVHVYRSATITISRDEAEQIEAQQLRVR